MKSYRDLWLWLGGLFLALAAFFVAIAIAYFTKETHYSLNGPWLWAAVASFVIAFACFFGAILGWRIPPWTRTQFPNIQVTIFGQGNYVTEREPCFGLKIPAQLAVFNARLVNTESEQNVSLTLRLYVKLRPGSFGRVGEMVGTPPDWPLSPSLNLDPIHMPIGLAPGEAKAGDLVYELAQYYLPMLAENSVGRLEMEDHISGIRRNITAQMGTYDKSRMTPSSGGIEILGPEYEPEGADEVSTQSGTTQTDSGQRSSEKIQEKPSSHSNDSQAL